MSLLIATPLSTPDIGGPATHVGMLTTLLGERKIAHTIVSFRDVRHLKPGIRHLVYVWRLWQLAGTAKRLYALDASSVGAPALIVSWLRRIPLTVRIAGITAWELGAERGQVHVTLDDFLHDTSRYPFSVRLRLWIERLVLKRAEQIIVPSEYFKQVIVSLGGIGEGKIEVVYSGFTPQHDANVLTENREPGFILSAGRLVPWKGFSTLIEAVVRVHERMPSAHLAILGEGGERTELEHQIARHDAGDYIKLMGAVSAREMQTYLAHARVFVLNTGYEGLSHQLLEVMDAGMPIVTTPAGGNVELIEDRKEGLLVPYNDVSALEEAISEVLVDAKLAQSLAYNAYRKAREFANDKHAERLVTLLQV
jgi:glycosyltransferase involved in cell wall biosynthesis